MRKEKYAARKTALYGILIALAMVMSFIETLIPIPLPVPGVKIGLANLVTITGLYLVGIPGTICVTILRVVLIGFTFGNPYSMISNNQTILIQYLAYRRILIPFVQIHEF